MKHQCLCVFNFFFYSKFWCSQGQTIMTNWLVNNLRHLWSTNYDINTEVFFNKMIIYKYKCNMLFRCSKHWQNDKLLATVPLSLKFEPFKTKQFTQHFYNYSIKLFNNYHHIMFIDGVARLWNPPAV